MTKSEMWPWLIRGAKWVGLGVALGVGPYLFIQLFRGSWGLILWVVLVTAFGWLWEWRRHGPEGDDQRKKSKVQRANLKKS